MTFLARHGRLLLIAGLSAGIALPPLARAFEPWLAPLIGGLLFLSAWRIGWRRAAGDRHEVQSTLASVVLLQLLLPVALALVFGALGWSGPLAQAVVLMSAGATIAGAANLAQFLGHDGSAALRMLVFGTALLPLTAIPVFALTGLAGADELATFAGRLLVLIVLSTVLGFAARRYAPAVSDTALDGVAALVMALVVIGLMADVGPALVHAPMLLAGTLLAAFAANFALQGLAFAVQKPSERRVAMSIVAGNRNMALFVAALPGEAIAPLMLFVGCYQIPMYLTPVLLARLYGGPQGRERG